VPVLCPSPFPVRCWFPVALPDWKLLNLMVSRAGLEPATTALKEGLTGVWQGLAQFARSSINGYCLMDLGVIDARHSSHQFGSPYIAVSPHRVPGVYHAGLLRRIAIIRCMDNNPTKIIELLLCTAVLSEGYVRAADAAPGA
jgi:hypothetical protein